MVARDVRKTIMSFVNQHLDMRGPADTDLSASSMSTATTSHAMGQSTHTMNESVMSEPPPAPETADIEPLYVHTQRELETKFQDMQQFFEGRETEHNWSPRDKSIRTIRRMLRGNAPEEFHSAFVSNVISMRDNILKVANTLRTTMSTNGCQLVQELYRSLGSAVDPMTEIMLQNFIKMSAATKVISGKNADATMETILSNCTFSHRLLHHIWLTFGEKNMQTRCFAPGWLKVLMKKNATHKAHVEHAGGIDLIEKCLKKGLEDANPKVRESTRSAFWTFAQIWPDYSER
jgi:CLIP-associating protein 1/2